MSLILCAGGGTLGPVIPLLAVIRAIKKRRSDIRFAWAGTPTGPEREVVEAEGIPFYPIHVAKFPRYPSIKWLTWPWDYWKALQQSKRCLDETRPSLVCSMGGFTSVPIIRQAAKRSISCVIHQLDAEPGYSNRLVAHLCRSVTTSFSYRVSPFSVPSQSVPTPCRFAGKKVVDKTLASKFFSLDPSRPAVLFVGGGTGAVTLNQAVQEIRAELSERASILHVTGKGKMDEQGGEEEDGYSVHEFLEEEGMGFVYTAADLVVSRAGMGAISELAFFSKPTILVPLPGHQLANAKLVPVPVVEQGEDFSKRLLKQIDELLADERARTEIGKKFHDSFSTDDGSALAERWLELLKM